MKPRADSLQSWIDQAFPDRTAPLDRDGLWHRIQSGLPARRKPTRVRWIARLAIPALSLLVAISVVFWMQDPAELPAPVEGPALQRVSVAALTDANGLLEDWVRTHRAAAYQESAPVLAVIDQAISDLEGRVRANPGNAELSRKLIYYAHWRADLLNQIAGANL